MKLLTWILLSLGMVWRASAASAELVLDACMFTGSEWRFIISDRSDGRISPWLRAGDEFKGLKLVSYDEKLSEVILMGGGREERVRLKLSRVREHPLLPSTNDFTLLVELDGSVTFAGHKVDLQLLEERLRLLAAKEPKVSYTISIDPTMDLERAKSVEYAIRKAMRAAGFKAISAHLDTSKAKGAGKR